LFSGLTTLRVRDGGIKLNLIVQKLISDKLVGVFIAFDFAVIFAMGFPQFDEQSRELFSMIDALCLCFFVCEASLKIKFLSWPSYWSKGLNRLDFIVLLAALPSLLIPLVGVNLMVLRFARFLRLVRVFRFIPNVDHLWIGARRALKASVGLCLGLAVYAFVLGAVACQLFGKVTPALFGDPLISTYTMFQVFTIEGWHEVPRAVIAGLDPDSLSIFGVRAFFVLSVLTGGVIGLSLTNAVFVDEMMMDNHDHLERKIDTLTEEIIKLRAEVRGPIGSEGSPGD
jgi:voltage-gated sodium channel